MDYMFINNDKRINIGGSAFIEFQYCKLNFYPNMDNILNEDSIGFWKDDSLYITIDDIDEFISNYGSVFNWGIYNDLKSGIDDIYGINYYSLEKVRKTIEIIKKKKPLNYLVLSKWLNDAFSYNGFYIIGI